VAARRRRTCSSRWARWCAGTRPDDESERDLFRALSVYQWVYAALLFYNNHFVAGDPAFGPEQSSIIHRRLRAARRAGGDAARAPDRGAATAAAAGAHRPQREPHRARRRAC
jgi:hypothetical protein